MYQENSGSRIDPLRRVPGSLLPQRGFFRTFPGFLVALESVRQFPVDSVHPTLIPRRKVMKLRPILVLAAVASMITAMAGEGAGVARAQSLAMEAARGRLRYSRSSVARPTVRPYRATNRTGSSPRMYKEGDPVQGRLIRGTSPRSVELLVKPRRPVMAGPQPEPPRARGARPRSGPWAIDTLPLRPHGPVMAGPQPEPPRAWPRGTRFPVRRGRPGR